MWKRGNKFGRTKVRADGNTYDSKLEAAVGALLKARQLAGEILEIYTQQTVRFTDAQIGYRADFKIIMADGSTRFVEAKGFPRDVWKIKLKLWRFYGPAPLEIWCGTYKKPFLSEIVYPPVK